MMELMLVAPTERYARQVMDYRREMLQNGDSLDGCAGLEDVDSFSQWIQFETRLRAKYQEGYVPSQVFLAVRRGDDRLVGMIDFRYQLSEYLLYYGGNIGYSVRPDERRKGYATQMLKMLLPLCQKAGARRVLVVCDRGNEASRKTILANGGVLENEGPAAPGSSDVIQRYWIALPQPETFSSCRELQPFLNEKGQLTHLPAKRKKQLAALYYLSSKFAEGQDYTEAQVNDLLDCWTTFHDPATLRREMYNRYFLNRTNDGKRYWKAESLPALETLLNENS